MNTTSDSSTATRRRPRSLALDVVDKLVVRINTGLLAAGAKLPTEAEIMEEYGVSRTVVREALSKLQASGQVVTRQGIGTFVIGASTATPFRINSQQLETLHDVIAVLELRIGLETEAAGLAARRRTDDDLRAMQEALMAFSTALDEGRDAIGSDYQFHLEIARATHNPHYVGMMGALGMSSIPRSRLDSTSPHDAEHIAYLRFVNREHESIYDAIANQDSDAARAAMRTHIGNSRERRRKAALNTL